MTLAMVYRTTLLLAVSLSIAGCEVIGGIFRAGFWVGVIIILVVIAIIVWLMRRGRGAA